MLSVNLDAPPLPPLVRDLRVRCMRGLWQHAGPLSPSARELRPCGEAVAPRCDDGARASAMHP